MKRKKQAFTIADCCVLLVVLVALDTVNCKRIKMCEVNPSNSVTAVVLSVNTAKLNGYPGTCRCTIRSVNIKTNIKATMTIMTSTPNTKCASASGLTMSFWNYTSCVNPSQTKSMLLDVNRTVEILLNVIDFGGPEVITGNINFTSDNASIVLRCYNASYTTTPRPTTTTVAPTPPQPIVITPEPPIVGTVVSAALIVFGGFLVLLIPITLVVRFRDRRNRDHDAELANLKQIIPDMEKDKVDPKMVNYSWLKTLTLRLLKRFYNNEGRQRRSRAGGRSARSLSEARNESTGTQARKRFQSLFKKRSTGSTSSSSIKSQSNVSDHRVEVETKAEHTELNDISMQQGGGIFMDARSRSDISPPNGSVSTRATVHNNLPVVTENNGNAGRLGTEAMDGYQDLVFDDVYENIRPNTPPADYEDVRLRENGVGNMANGHPPRGDSVRHSNMYAVVNKTKK